MLQIHVLQRSDESGITSLALWNNCLAAAYANGMIRIFDVEHGECLSMEVINETVAF